MLKWLGLSLLAVALVTACTAKQPTMDHGQHEQISGSMNEQGHGDHGNDKQDIKVKTFWKLSSDKLQSNQPVSLLIQIFNTKGKPIESFDISHEKKMHLIVVSKDLSYFDHLHPEYTNQGKFEIGTSFPKDGEYKLIADFIPAGGQQKTETHWVRAGTDEGTQLPVIPDNNLTQIVEGKEVTLRFDKLQAGTEVQMTFTLKDAKTQTPITTLEPYLGAAGHVVMLSENAEQYIHNHPIDEKATGPEASFSTSFPKGGVYKIWGQFQHEGKVFVVPFVVKVS
jgi:hypothetical protein